MNLNEELKAGDPSPDTAPRVLAAITTLAAEAETMISWKSRGRRLLAAGGVAGAVLLGAGVANASGLPVLGIGGSHPQPKCTVIATVPLPSGPRSDVSIEEHEHNLTILQSQMANQTDRVRAEGNHEPPTGASSDSSTDSVGMLPDLVQRLTDAQKKLATESVCPAK